MNKQEEQEIREAIDSLLPLKDLDEYLKELKSAHNTKLLFCRKRAAVMKRKNNDL